MHSTQAPRASAAGLLSTLCRSVTRTTDRGGLGPALRWPRRLGALLASRLELAAGSPPAPPSRRTARAWRRRRARPGTAGAHCSIPRGIPYSPRGAASRAAVCMSVCAAARASSRRCVLLACDDERVGAVRIFTRRMQLLVSTLLLSGTVQSQLVQHPGSAAVRGGAAGAAAPGVFIATSRYIPAAPDSVGLCSFAVASSRWSCNTSWAYHPVPVTGALAALPSSGCLYVAAVANLGYPGLSAVRGLPLGTSTPCAGALPGVLPGAITQLRVWNSGVLIADGTLVAQGAGGGARRIGAGKLFWSSPSSSDSQGATAPLTMLDYKDLSSAANTTQNCTLSNRGVVLGDTYVDACFCAGGGGGSVQVGLGPGGKTVVSPLVNGFLMNTLAVDRVRGELLTDQSTSDGTGSLSIDIVALKLQDLGSTRATPRIVISNLNQVCGTTGLPGRGVRNALIAPWD